MYVLLLVPTVAPFKYHWYCGFTPSLPGVAVNVTFVPSQIVVASAATVTLTGRLELIVIVTVSEEAGFPVVQIASDVSTQ